MLHVLKNTDSNILKVPQWHTLQLPGKHMQMLAAHLPRTQFWVADACKSFNNYSGSSKELHVDCMVFSQPSWLGIVNAAWLGKLTGQ